jgi:hypothetical protein
MFVGISCGKANFINLHWGWFIIALATLQETHGFLGPEHEMCQDFRIDGM